MPQIVEIAKRLVTPGKGILAADESLGTIQKRFDKVGVENTEENRRKWRELLFTAQGVEKFISGVILFDETTRQTTGDGRLFVEVLEGRGEIAGVKVDEGKESRGREFVTGGLERLGERLDKYVHSGLKFTKWRAVTVVGEGLPTQEVVEENSRGLAEFARISQEVGMVPVVEPEILMDGNHGIDKCEDVSIKVLTSVFGELERKKIDLSGMLLKTNFVVPGKESGEELVPGEAAKKTLRVLTKCVPPEVPGVVFLSGGLSAEVATSCLNEVNKIKGASPWELSFSYGRALQGPPLEKWHGEDKNKYEAQALFYERAKLNSLARFGEYTGEMEK